MYLYYSLSYAMPYSCNCDIVGRLKVGLSWIMFRMYGLPLH